jgi:hypothetical protein
MIREHSTQPLNMATATRHPFTTAEWSALKRCERILHRWAENECNGAIQYDDDGNNPRRYGQDRYGSFTIAGPVIPDKSETAMEQARRIAAKHGLSVYNQTDPRGCALYVFSAADLNGRRIDECYSSLARAVV